MSNGKSSFRLVPVKSQAELSSEWDKLANLRFEQLSGGRDITFERVISPEIIKLLLLESPKTVIEAGCGTGVLTKMISVYVQHIFGIDPSSNSIDLAKRFSPKNADFSVHSIENFANKYEKSLTFL